MDINLSEAQKSRANKNKAYIKGRKPNSNACENSSVSLRRKNL